MTSRMTKQEGWQSNTTSWRFLLSFSLLLFSSLLFFLDRENKRKKPSQYLLLKVLVGTILPPTQHQHSAFVSASASVSTTERDHTTTTITPSPLITSTLYEPTYISLVATERATYMFLYLGGVRPRTYWDWNLLCLTFVVVFFVQPAPFPPKKKQYLSHEIHYVGICCYSI